jgi:hypothetical protein
LWIIGSALFVLAVAFVKYSEIKKQFDPNPPDALKADQRAVAVLCADALGVAHVDYFVAGENCWYGISKFRRFYTAYNDLSDDEIRKLDAVRGFVTRINLWETVGVWVAIALGIPLAVLALGSSLLWALSGFTVALKP